MADDEWFRNMAAQNLAHAALIETLLRFAFRELTADGAEEVGKTIKEQLAKTDFITGLTKGDEFASERVADLIVRMQEHAATLVDIAVAAARAVEHG